MKNAARDFFFLANNLRDSSRASLLGNPELLRTWITAISLAQHSPCPDTDAGRGQFPDDVPDLCRRIAAITGDKVSKVEAAGRGLDGIFPYGDARGLLHRLPGEDQAMTAERLLGRLAGRGLESTVRFVGSGVTL